MKKQEIRVRAAPSPTGRVHIGNMRTFLYDYLYAKNTDGKFVLRIEDTDQKRKVKGGIEGIVETLKLYGIEFDEGPDMGGDYGPYIQSERIELYAKYAEELVESGKGYRCFCSEERLEELREGQEKNKQKTGYDSKCRNLDAKEVTKRLEAGEESVVRMKFPKEGVTKFKDLIYGEIKIKNSEVEDLILLKADKYPTYHFAVVIDDHLMEISHVLRGREYLADTTKNLFLYEAFGWESPVFVHVPHILNPEGKGKLGKRHGALPAIAYLRKGYLPAAVLNYLALAGWAPDPKKAHQDEIYSIEELAKLFTLDRVHKAGAKYDQQKMDYMNGKHIRNFKLNELVEVILKWAEEIVLKDFIADKFDDHPKWETELREKVGKTLPIWKKDMEYFEKAIKLIAERLTYLGELPDLMDFFYDEKLSWVDEDWNTKNHDKKELADALEGVLPKLSEIFEKGEFDHDKWEEAVRGYADELDWKHGDMFMAIRSATTGRLQSPPLLECFEVMGWEKAGLFVGQAIKWLRK